MKILELITLQAIYKIFEDCEDNVSDTAKLIYMNCLIHHFKEKKATFSNCIAFDITDTDIDFERFKKQFHELHKQKIITINGSIITFNNVWGKYIDRSKLDKDTEENATARNNFIPAEKIKNELLSSQSLQEICQMKYGITKDRITYLIDLFIKEQTAFSKTYSTPADCIKHFTYWLNYNKDKKTETEKSKVKSKGKLLGK